MTEASLRDVCTPLVTIGMPVRNGEATIVAAIESLLAQTESCFRIHISDNASTDRTADLCRGLCAKDDRISYERLPEDIGAVANFNRLLDAADTEFFMWAACDDFWVPEFLACTLRQLRQETRAVGCAAGVWMVNGAGGVVQRYGPPVGLASGHLTRRVRAALSLGSGRGGLAVYGLFRRSLLTRECRFPSVWSPDVGFVFALGLRHPFTFVDETLLQYREPDHVETKVQRSARDEYLYERIRARDLYCWLIQETFRAPLGIAQEVAVCRELARMARTEWRGRLLSDNLDRVRRDLGLGRYSRACGGVLMHVVLRPRALLEASTWERIAADARRHVGWHRRRARGDASSQDYPRTRGAGRRRSGC